MWRVHRGLPKWKVMRTRRTIFLISFQANRDWERRYAWRLLLSRGHILVGIGFAYILGTVRKGTDFLWHMSPVIDWIRG